MVNIGPNELLDKGFYVTTPVPLYHVVVQSDIEECALAGADADWLGIAQEEADELDVERGRVVRVRPMGISRGVAGAAFAMRDRLTTDANGRLVAAAPAAGVTVRIVAIALTPTAAVGDWADVQLVSPGITVTG